MTLDELLVKRRSIRKFQARAISKQQIEGLIKDSILAPSAGNEQPWKFIVVLNPELINRISDDCKKNMLQRIAANPDDYAKKYEKMLRKEAFHIFYHAPAVLFILGETGLKNLYVDCALAAGYLMMSATSRGLGSCWVNFGTAIRDQELRSILGLTDSHKIIAPIALGYPERIPDIPHRNDPQILRIIE